MSFKQHLSEFWAWFLGKKERQKPAQQATGKPALAGTAFAFACGGKRYYTWANEMDLPVERALAAKDVYSELEQGISSKYLEDLFQTCEKLLDKGKLVQTSQLIGLAKARVGHISNALLLYKLASVLYLEEGENPYSYDLLLEEKKIENWIKNKDVESFFLQEPIKKYIPSFDSLAMSIKTYFKAQGESISQALQFHLSLLEEMPASEALKKSIKQQLEQTKLLTQLAD